MTAKEYMEKVQEAEQEMQMIAEKRQHYLHLGGALGANFAGMPGAHDNHSRVEIAAVGMADLMTELDKRMADYSAYVKKAQDLVDQIPVLNFRKVLTYHYFLGKPMKEVNEIMGFADDKSAYRVRGYALRELQKLMG